MFDGREIWHLPWKPKIQRWYSDEMVTKGAGLNPTIGPFEEEDTPTDVESEKTDMIFKNMDHIMSLSAKECMNINVASKQVYACGLNIKDESYSSRRVVVDNTPCTPGH